MKKRIGFIFLLFLAAVAIKLAAAYYIGGKFHPKLWEYEEIALNLISGKGFLSSWDVGRFNIEWRSMQDPFFPIWCAVIYLLTNHSIFTVLILQILYASLIPVVIFYITRRIYDNKTAILSSVLSVFLPGINYYAAVNLHQMPLYALFFCLLALAALRFSDHPGLKNQIFLGLTLGVSFLIRSTAMFIALAIFIWLGFMLKAGRREKNLAFSRIILIAVLLVVPWIARNFFVHKRPIFFQTYDGYCLYIATNPQATGTLYLSDGRFQLDALPTDLLSKYERLSETQFRDIMLLEAFKYIRQDPLRQIRLALRRFFYFWWFSPFSGRAPGYAYPASYVKLYQTYYTALLFLFLWQLFSAIRGRLAGENPYFNQEALIILVLLAVAMPHIILYPEGRHRFAIEPLMLIIASRRIILWSNALIRKI